MRDILSQEHKPRSTTMNNYSPSINWMQWQCGRIAMALLLLSLTLVVSPKGGYAENTTRIVIGDTFDGTGEREAEPLKRLSKKLKEQSRQNTFRLIWGSSGTQSYNATALYNRQAKTVKYYSITYVGGLGNENIQAIVKQWICRNVTDKMIHQLSTKHQNVTGASDDSFLSELPRYGAKIHIIESRQIASLPSTKP